jgi:hypothetical protein
MAEPVLPGAAAARHAAMERYRELSGHVAPPPPPPLDEAVVLERSSHPWPCATGDGRQVGAFVEGLGFALGVFRPRRGHRVLEVGATVGHLSLLMAGLGCAVTLQADDPSDAEALRRRAARAGVSVTILRGTPGDAGVRFDFVLSQGSLRRRLDHLDLLVLARDALLAPGGRLVLVGEPMTEDLPLPWMFDPSAGATEAIRARGKVELAFRPSYLLAALDELGFHATMSVCSASPFGNTIVAGRRTAAQRG